MILGKVYDFAQLSFCFLTFYSLKKKKKKIEKEAQVGAALNLLSVGNEIMWVKGWFGQEFSSDARG